MPDLEVVAATRQCAGRRARLGKWTWRLVSGVTLLFATAIALVSYRYVLGLPPAPPNIAGNHLAWPWLPIHAGIAATALLVGGLQFSAVLRRGRPSVHRYVGRTYIVACITGGASGIVLALGSTAGPVATTGFGLLGVLWIYTTALGWQRARDWRFGSHRRWMIRSWSLTLAAVTLRLYIGLAEFAGLPEEAAYRAISFLCWIPNLILAELMLRNQAVPLRASPAHLANLASDWPSTEGSRCQCAECCNRRQFRMPNNSPRLEPSMQLASLANK